MSAETVTLALALSEQEAWDFAQFLKRAGFSDYRSNAVDQDEAYRMLYVGEKVRGCPGGGGDRSALTDAPILSIPPRHRPGFFLPPPD